MALRQFYPPSIKKKKGALDAHTIDKVAEIFKEKGWHLTQDIFQKYCEVLEVLNIEQRNLLFDLTKDFLWIDFDKYMGYIEKTLNSIPFFKMANIDKIYICPLVKSETKRSNNSAYLCVNLYESHRIRGHAVLRGKVIKPYHTLEGVEEIKLNTNDILFVVDDFIGSGKTAIEAIFKMNEKYEIDLDKIYLLSLIGQKEGINNVKEKGIDVFCGTVRNKGMSDKYAGEILESNKKIMEDIEKVIKVKKKYKFGFKQSEALVSMIRTPNNSFPIYWAEFQYQGKKIIAPFERRKIYNDY